MLNLAKFQGKVNHLRLNADRIAVDAHGYRRRTKIAQRDALKKGLKYYKAQEEEGKKVIRKRKAIEGGNKFSDKVKQRKLHLEEKRNNNILCDCENIYDEKDKRKMVKCSDCGEWYHLDCIPQDAVNWVGTYISCWKTMEVPSLC